jgi:7-keto-8-aminopelargonate synthetase-like enzyme
MEGDIAQLPGIVDLAKKYDTAIMVDDAHAIGVLGDKGDGTAAHFGLTNEVDLIMGTFSKSLASIGGFIAAKREVIQYLKHFARALIFSASMAPACVAAVSTALDIIINEPERRQRLWDNTNYLISGLKQLGYNTGRAETPVIPVIVGDDELVFKTWRFLHDEGIFVNPVVSPAVPPNRALIRLSVMATHSREQLRFALDKMEQIGNILNLI